MRGMPIGWLFFLAGLLALVVSFIYDAEGFSGTGPRLVALCATVVGAVIIFFGRRKSPR